MGEDLADNLAGRFDFRGRHSQPGWIGWARIKQQEEGHTVCSCHILPTPDLRATLLLSCFSIHHSVSSWSMFTCLSEAFHSHPTPYTPTTRLSCIFERVLCVKEVCVSELATLTQVPTQGFAELGSGHVRLQAVFCADWEDLHRGCYLATCSPCLSLMLASATKTPHILVPCVVKRRGRRRDLGSAYSGSQRGLAEFHAFFFLEES